MGFPPRGDILLRKLNPTPRQEQQGEGPVFAVSPKAFNRSGLTVVCPITRGGNQARYAGFAVSLIGTGSETQGIVMCNQPRTLDLAARQGKFLESAPDYVTGEVLARLQAIIE